MPQRRHSEEKWGGAPFMGELKKSKMKYYIKLDYKEALRWPKKTMRQTEERGKTTKDYKKSQESEDTMERRGEKQTARKRRDF